MSEQIIYSEGELRERPSCIGCGSHKGLGPVVCWKCFKQSPVAGVEPLKYCGVSTEEWQRQVHAGREVVETNCLMAMPASIAQYAQWRGWDVEQARAFYLECAGVCVKHHDECRVDGRKVRGLDKYQWAKQGERFMNRIMESDNVHRLYTLWIQTPAMESGAPTDRYATFEEAHKRACDAQDRADASWPNNVKWSVRKLENGRWVAVGYIKMEVVL